MHYTWQNTVHPLGLCFIDQGSYFLFLSTFLFWIFVNYTKGKDQYNKKSTYATSVFISYPYLVIFTEVFASKLQMLWHFTTVALLCISYIKGVTTAPLSCTPRWIISPWYHVRGSPCSNLPSCFPNGSGGIYSPMDVGISHGWSIAFGCFSLSLFSSRTGLSYFYFLWLFCSHDNDFSWRTQVTLVMESSPLWIRLIDVSLLDSGSLARTRQCCFTFPSALCQEVRDVRLCSPCWPCVVAWLKWWLEWSLQSEVHFLLWDW